MSKALPLRLALKSLFLLFLFLSHGLVQAQTLISYPVDNSATDYSLIKAVGLPGGKSAVIYRDNSYNYKCNIVSSNGTVTGTFDFTSKMTLQNIPSRIEVNALGTSSGNIWITYTSSASDGPPSSINARYLVLDQSGNQVYSGTLNSSNPGSTLNRFIRMDQLSNGNVVMVWLQSDNMSGGYRIFQLNGTPVTNDASFAGPASSIFNSTHLFGGSMVAANPNGGFLITFYYYNGNFRGMLFDNNGAVQQVGGSNTFTIDPANYPTPVGSYTNISALGLSNGNYMIAWAQNSGGTNTGYYKIISATGSTVKAQTIFPPALQTDISTYSWVGAAANNTSSSPGFVIADYSWQDYDDWTNPHAKVVYYNFDLSGNYLSSKDASPYFIADVYGPTVSVYSGNPSGVGVVYTHYKSYTPNGGSYTTSGVDISGSLYGFGGASLSNNAALSNLTFNSGTLSPVFASGTTSYTASVCNATSAITVIPTVAESNATVTVNNTSVTSGSASGSISLAVGANSITVKVTAQDGTTTSTYTITVTRAAALSGTTTVTNVACYGGNSGAIDLTPSGGTLPYTYNWIGGVTTQDRVNLVAGSYSVTITDAKGCTGVVNVMVTQPAAAVSVTQASKTNVSCNGGSNGVASVNTPTGGTGPYTYNWTPGNPTGDGTASVTGLTAGTWTCTVTDAKGCTTSTTFNITQPAAPLSITGWGQSNLLCNGGSDGEARVTTIAGGTPGYTYSWSPSGGSAAIASGLSAGDYTVTITDVNGCTASRTVNITEPSALIASPATQTNVTCSGGSNGSATVSVAGGTGTYTYSWSPSGGSAATASGLAAGDYTVTVTDANTCSTTQSFTITQPAAVAISSVTVPANGTYTGGNTLGFTVNYNQNVTVNTTGGTPYITLTMNTGGTRQASYVSGSGTSSLVFRHTLNATDQDADGISVGSNITLNGGTIKNSTGCDALSALNGLASTTGIRVHNPVAQTITFGVLSTKTYGDPDFDLSATTTSGLSLTYTSSNTAVATIVGDKIHIVGAGSSIITATQAGDANYLPATAVAQTLTVNAKAVTVTADAKAKTYGDVDPALTYTVSPALISGDAFTGSLSRTAGEAVGAYAINQNTLALNGNYTLTYAGADLTITKKAVTVTTDAKTKTYGDADPSLTYTVSPALITGDAFTGSLSRAAGEGVGAYAINQNTLALNGNYTLTYAGADLTITKKAVTVTAGAKTKIYGDVDPALTYTVSPALISGDAFTGSLSRAAGEGVGAYTINQNTLALNGNYTVTYAGADLTITKKTVTVTADVKTKTYGNADPALTYVVSPALVSGDVFTGELNRTAGEDVGAYAINQNTLALNNNYVLNYTGADLTITKKAVTVTADAKSKTYGNADPALTYTVSPALISGDVFIGSLNRTAGEAVGAYAINQNTLALNGNYTLTYTGADLTITKKAVTVTAAAKTKTYGDADPALTYTVSPALISGDAFTGSLSRAAGEDVGAYAINQNTLALNNNYVLNYTGADLTITKKAVTVTADTKTKIYGNADPTLTYVVSPALISGDAFTGSLSRAAGEDVGAYAINQNTLALNNNYVLNYTGADLTITKKAVTVTADTKTKIYGNADPTLTYVVSPALISGDAFTGALSRTAGEDVGAYAINQNTLALNGNYTITYSGADLTITKKAVTVTADAKTKTYGNADPAFTYTVSPALLSGDVFTGALSRTAGENAGTYPITQGSLNNNNYAISFVSAALTINKAAQQITWNQALIAGCDGNTNIALTATASSGLPVSYQSANTAVATINGTQLIIAGPGNSIITASQPGNNNYLPATDVQQELLSKLPAHLLVKRWDDVLVFDNSSKQYTAWQWYKNGAIINGATGQYYYESSKLNGDYYVVVKTVGGTTLQTCAVTITPGSVFIPLSVTPNPVDPGQTVIARTSYTTAQLQGASIVVSNVMGVVVQTIQNVTPQTTISMQHAPGLYVVRLRLANGATASVNLLVKPQ